MNDKLRNYIIENILTSDDVCKLLGVTRQRLAAIVSNPKSGLKPFKTNKSGNLYFKEDVVAYLNSRINATSLGFKREIIGNCTSEAIEAVKAMLESGDLIVDDILEISIYRYESDAVKDGYWIEDGGYSPQTLLSVTSPTFVIYMKDGRQFWLHGLNCGYWGESPAGSKEVLNKLFNIDIPELDNYLKKKRSINLINNGSKQWLLLPGKYEFEADNRVFVPLSYCCYEHSLVLAEYKHETVYDAERCKALIEAIMPFIRSPFQVVLTQVRSSLYGNGTYNTIIRDKNGTELWLYNTFSESLDATVKRFFKQKDLHTITLKDVFKGLEFEINEDLFTDEEKNYIDTPLRIHTIS